ncbi:BREX-1 system adenine-specific DNA-methyltransferase PglX [Flavobacterium flavipallidum]|uniref:site-specific DNA-methyltransferase (adenine-specific) n=1 Tax=Flavobacterium flavipallidum TaxID=3139140 RepID=A0ABU9HPM4_9FLAO
MNTNNIKSFAKQARLLLMEGVKQRLLYWGFDENGNTTTTVNPTVGGYEFRGNIFTDESVPPKWNKLKAKLTNKQAVQDTIEEAAYTWFNRIMAIKILEKRGYISPTLEYVKDLKTPQIVQEAKRGQHQLKQQKYVNLLQEYLLADQEEQALGLLLTRLCNNNTLIHDVFGRIDDYTEILLPTNLLARNGIIDLINSDAIEDEQFQEVELIGWLYQFYISDKKDEVFKGFKANKKARPEDIPAATQIFTPKWIVKYMVENTVGKIYLDYDKTSDLKSEMKYLVENEEDTLSPRAESRGLIHNLEDLTLIDPASGSGHILVTGFELLFKMYREQGYTAKNAVISILQNNLFGLDIDDRAMQLARFAVLLKAAEFYPEILNASDSNPLVLPHIYSFPENTIDYIFTPEAISVSRLKEYLDYQLAEDVVDKYKIDYEDEDTGEVVSIDRKDVIVEKSKTITDEVIKNLNSKNITSVIVRTYKPISEFIQTSDYKTIKEIATALSLLQQGKNIGAALKLNLKPETFNLIENQFQDWNNKQLQGKLDFLQTDLWNNLKPFLEVLLVMTKKYTAVVANPPYMGQKSMNAELKEYLQYEYPNSWNDLMTTFMEVNLNLLIDNGSTAIINIPSWMFLSTYEELRINLLKNIYFSSVLHFGRGVFGSDFGSVSFTLVKNKSLTELKGVYRGLYDKIGNVENIEIKENYFLDNEFKYFRHKQSEYLKIPQKTISYWLSSNALDKYKNKTIKDICPPVVGMMTSDNNRFVRYWQEVSKSKIGFFLKDRLEAESSSYKWFPYNKGGEFRRWFGNNEYIVNWESGGRDIYNNGMTSFRGKNYYFKKGITWSFFGFNNFGVRFKDDGYIFDISGMSSFPSSDELYFFIALLNSNVGFLFLQAVAPTVNFQANDISSVPVQFPDKLTDINKLTINSIDLSRKDWNSRETSWDFEQSPLLNNSTSLKEAYQKWQHSVTQDFFQLHENEEELNRIFIDIYGLQEELTPEVALKDITILQEELDRNALEQLEPVFRTNGKEAVELPIYKDEVISQFLSYSIGLFMGRYRLDKPGLHIAHPNPTEEELAPYEAPPVSPRAESRGSFQFIIDDDAIIPLMGSECAFPDDALVRIKNLIHDLWGEDTLTENLNFVNECLGTDLDKWLTEKFWGYHTSMYKKKPIYWLFSSNPKKPQAAAFKVVAYMHRMDKYTVSKIQRNYLHPHQEWIKLEIEKLVTNEANLSKNELKRLEKLRTWEIECRDYNEVLKELANQEITFDLDDGVTVNYAKFEGAVAKI